MKTLAEVKAQYEEQEVGSMTTDEVYAYAKELEELVKQQEEHQKVQACAYGIGRDDIRYFLSSILNIAEEYVSDDLIDDAFLEVKQRFSLEEESELFSNFISGALDVKSLHSTYTGILSPDGSVLNLYFHDEPGMGLPDATLTGDAVETFLEKVFGEEFDLMVDTSPFTFDRSQLEDM